MSRIPQEMGFTSFTEITSNRYYPNDKRHLEKKKWYRPCVLALYTRDNKHVMKVKLIPWLKSKLKKLPIIGFRKNGMIWAGHFIE